jgi:hypothetical protein
MNTTTLINAITSIRALIELINNPAFEISAAFDKTTSALDDLNSFREEKEFDSLKSSKDFHRAYSVLVTLAAQLEFPEHFTNGADPVTLLSKLNEVYNHLENFKVSNSL